MARTLPQTCRAPVRWIRLHPLRGLAVLFFIFVCMLPLAAPLTAAAGTGGSGGLVPDARRLRLLLRSVTIASATAGCATVLGLLFAAGLCRIGGRLRKFFLYLLLVPLLVPPYVLGIAWPRMMAEWDISVTGCGWTVALLTICYFPLAAFIAYSAVSVFDRRLLDAARLRYGWWGILVLVIAPVVGRNLAVGFLVIFLLGLGEYGLAALMQVQTFPVEIMTELSAFYDLGATVRLCLVLFLVSLVPMLLLGWLTSRGYRHLVPRRAGTGTPARGTRASLPAAVFLVIVLALTAGTTVCAVVTGLEGMDSFVRAWRTASGQVGWSLLFCSTAAVVAVLVGWPLAWVQIRAPALWRRLLDVLVLLPFVVPGSVMAVGYIALLSGLGLQSLRSHWLIMPIVFVGGLLPVAQKALVASFSIVRKELWEAAELAPRRKHARIIFLDIPFVYRGLLFGLLAVFALSFRELSATVLLIPPGCETLALRTYTLSHYGADDMVMALCLIGMAIVVIPCLLTVFAGARERRR